MAGRRVSFSRARGSVRERMDSNPRASIKSQRRRSGTAMTEDEELAFEEEMLNRRKALAAAVKSSDFLTTFRDVNEGEAGCGGG